MIGELSSNPLRAARRQAAANSIRLSQRRTWYAEGDAPDNVTPPVTTDTAPSNSGAGVTLTQEALDKMIADRLKRDRDTQRKALLEELGYDDPAKLKADIAAKRQRDEAELSEVEKAQKLAEKAQSEAQTLKQQLDDERLERVKDRRDTAIENAATSAHAHKPKAAIRWAADEAPDLLTKCSNEDGTVNTAEVGKLIEAWKKAEPHQFQSGGAGSPSNFGGKPLSGNTDAAKRASMNNQRLIRG